MCHIIRVDDKLVSMEGCFGGRRAVRKSRSRIDYAFWRDAIDLLQPQKGKAQQGREGVGGRKWGGHGMKTGRIAIEEEEENGGYKKFGSYRTGNTVCYK
jgi:hypothetical protein